MKYRPGYRKFWIVGLAVTVALFGPSAQAASKLPLAVEKLLPQAKAEGEVSLFTGSYRVTAEDAARFSRVFEGVYGIPMKVTLAGLGGHPDFVRRLREEDRAGVRPPVDVIPTAIWLLDTIHKAGLIESVRWKDFGVSDNDLIAKLDAVENRVNVRAVIYNTKLVPRAEAPRKFDDLLNPKWKEKIIGPALPTGYAYIALVTGEQQAYDLVRRLVDQQKMALAPTFNDIGARVGNGEFAIGFGFPAQFDRRKGAPVENAPMKVGGFREAAAVLKKASHPAAAKLLVHFITTTLEGMKICGDLMDWGKANTPGSEPYKIAHEGGLVLAKDVTDEVEWEIKEPTRMGKRFKELLGL